MPWRRRASWLESGETGRRRLRDWLLRQQYQERHPYTGADPGGWALDRSARRRAGCGRYAGALLALAHPAMPTGCHARMATAGAALGWLGSAEPRRRLADLLPRLGQPAVRPQRQRSDGPRAACALVASGHATSDRRLSPATARRIDSDDASGRFDVPRAARSGPTAPGCPSGSATSTPPTTRTRPTAPPGCWPPTATSIG